MNALSEYSQINPSRVAVRNENSTTTNPYTLGDPYYVED